MQAMNRVMIMASPYATPVPISLLEKLEEKNHMGIENFYGVKARKSTHNDHNIPWARQENTITIQLAEISAGPSLSRIALNCVSRTGSTKLNVTLLAFPLILPGEKNKNFKKFSKNFQKKFQKIFKKFSKNFQKKFKKNFKKFQKFFFQKFIQFFYYNFRYLFFLRRLSTLT